MKKKLAALSGILIIIAIILILLNRQEHVPITSNPTSTPTSTPATGRIASVDSESEPEPIPDFTPTPTRTITPTPTIVDNPPQIISYDIPEEVESYFRFNINVTAEDDIGIEVVYLNIESLGRVDLSEHDGSWQGDSKIRKEGEYPYIITVIDSIGQEATAEGKMRCIVAEGDDDVDGSTGATF